MASDRVVRGAGGVISRRNDRGEIEVLLIYRRARGDWSFPKGKLEAGETDEDCALREVHEETGLRCQLEMELPATSYRDRKGRAKVVRYWSMTVVQGEAEPRNEVDAVRWLCLHAAVDVLTHSRDRGVLAAFATRLRRHRPLRGGRTLSTARPRARTPRLRRGRREGLIEKRNHRVTSARYAREGTGRSDADSGSREVSMERFDDEEERRRWRVALVAHPAKRAALARLVSRYPEHIGSWELLAPAATAAALSAGRAPKLLRALPDRGAVEAIEGAIATGEIDALVFLRDPRAAPDPDPEPTALLRVADLCNVPVATNLAAAECLVRALAPEGLSVSSR